MTTNVQIDRHLNYLINMQIPNEKNQKWWTLAWCLVVGLLIYLAWLFPSFFLTTRHLDPTLPTNPCELAETLGHPEACITETLNIFSQ